MNLEVAEIKQNVKFNDKVGRYNVSSELFVDFIFTERCNCHCKFCISNVCETAVVDFERWKANTKKLFELFDINDIIILGGEATLDNIFFSKLKYIEDLLRGQELKQRNIILTTNGTMLRNIYFLEKLSRSIITTVNVSYMNHKPNKNKSIMRSGKLLTHDELVTIRNYLNKRGITLRLNVNVFKGNCDTVEEIEEYVETMKDCADAIKFSPLIKTEHFGSVPEVSEFTDRVVMEQEEIDSLFDAVVAKYKKPSQYATNDKVFGYVKYDQLMIDDRQVILKHSQLSELFDVEHEIVNLKVYPNGNVSNIWDSRDHILDDIEAQVNNK